MRPFVRESRPHSDETAWAGPAVVTPAGTFPGPAVYAPGSEPHGALQNGERTSYLILVGGSDANEFLLEVPNPPASGAPIRLKFEWVSGTYLEGLETVAIWLAYGDQTQDNSASVTPIGPMQWQIDTSRSNNFGSNVLRVATRTADDGLLLHVWDVDVDGAAAIRGLYPLRQRQSLIGAGSWPLRQRQNGAHSGSWPLRQRQIGA